VDPDLGSDNNIKKDIIFVFHLFMKKYILKCRETDLVTWTLSVGASCVA